jgi:hypothetical protein
VCGIVASVGRGRASESQFLHRLCAAIAMPNIHCRRTKRRQLGGSSHKLSLQERDDLRFACAVTKEKLLKLIHATDEDLEPRQDHVVRLEDLMVKLSKGCSPSN